MSALPPIAHIPQCRWDVGKVPATDILKTANEGPIAKIHIAALLRTIGILPTKQKRVMPLYSSTCRRDLTDYFINVIGTSARWMTFMATEPRSRP